MLDWLAPVTASLATIGASAFVFWRVHVSIGSGYTRPFWPRFRRCMGTPLPRALARAALPEPAVPPGAQHLNPGWLVDVGHKTQARPIPPRGGTGVRPHPADKTSMLLDAISPWAAPQPSVYDELQLRRALRAVQGEENNRLRQKMGLPPVNEHGARIRPQ